MKSMVHHLPHRRIHLDRRRSEWVERRVRDHDQIGIRVLVILISRILVEFLQNGRGWIVSGLISLRFGVVQSVQTRERG